MGAGISTLPLHNDDDRWVGVNEQTALSAEFLAEFAPTLTDDTHTASRVVARQRIFDEIENLQKQLPVGIHAASDPEIKTNDVVSRHANLTLHKVALSGAEQGVLPLSATVRSGDINGQMGQRLKVLDRVGTALRRSRPISSGGTNSPLAAKLMELASEGMRGESSTRPATSASDFVASASARVLLAMLRSVMRLDPELLPEVLIAINDLLPRHALNGLMQVSLLLKVWIKNCIVFSFDHLFCLSFIQQGRLI